MRVVLQLDLMDDPSALSVSLTPGSPEDYRRLKRLYPPKREDDKYFTTVVWTEQQNKVNLYVYAPEGTY